MIYCVLGTRAQLIKMAPLIKAMEERQWDFTLLHTGQHRETTEDVRHDFGLKVSLGTFTQVPSLLRTIM
jgi:UDP-N-acetylglucosamine 2-epimerase (non-hydrolysing)